MWWRSGQKYRLTTDRWITELPVGGVIMCVLLTDAAVHVLTAISSGS